MEAPAGLSVETVASGVTGLLIAGAIIRQVFKGWIDAKAQTMANGANAAMVSAVAIGFDKEERAHIAQYLERIAKALEAISISQAALADEQKNEMDEKLDRLLDKADEAYERKRHQLANPPRRRNPAE